MYACMYACMYVSIVYIRNRLHTYSFGVTRIFMRQQSMQMMAPQYLSQVSSPNMCVCVCGCVCIYIYTYTCI